MPLWRRHDVCSYPWKSYTNFGVSTGHQTRPIPTYWMHIWKTTEQHWGYDAIPPRVPVDYILCIIYIYNIIYICMYEYTYQYDYTDIIWPFNLVYTHLYTDALHACSRNGVLHIAGSPTSGNMAKNSSRDSVTILGTRVLFLEQQYLHGDGSKPWYLVNPKIAGKSMFIPLKMYL